MSRFLCVAPPYAGHVYWLASIGAELALRGHSVAWVSYEPARAFVPPDATFFAVPDDDVLRLSLAAAQSPPPRFLAAEFSFFYGELIVPMALSMLPHVDAAVATWRPDVVLVDQHALAGALVARRRGLRWVTSSPTSLLHAKSVEHHAPAQRWLAELYARVQRDAGLEPVAHFDISPHLVLLFTSREMVGAASEFPEQFRFVGPMLDHRREIGDFPWEALRRRPRVLVSLGSVASLHGGRFFETVAAALRDEDVEVVLGGPEGILRDTPANFIVRPWLPQLRLLPHVDAVVSHGGGFAFEALAFGVPLVLAPVWSDQFATTQQVVAAGAGIRVRYGRVGVEEMRTAVRAVLDDPAYRRAAQLAASGLRGAGGTAAAADFVAAVA